MKALVLAAALVCYAVPGLACQNEKLEQFRKGLRDDLKLLACKVDQQRCEAGISKQ